MLCRHGGRGQGASIRGDRLDRACLARSSGTAYGYANNFAKILWNLTFLWKIHDADQSISRNFIFNCCSNPSIMINNLNPEVQQYSRGSSNSPPDLIIERHDVNFQIEDSDKQTGTRRRMR